MEECGCTLSTEELGKRREQVKEEIMLLVTKVSELEEGFELFWGNTAVGDEEEQIQLQNKVLAWIRAERKCCSFLSFELVFPKESGALSLRISGGGAVVKRSLQKELAPIIDRLSSSHI